MANTQPFNWGAISLSQVVDIDGTPHITKQAVGEWLEYAEPRKSINKIIERNQHIDHYSVDVNLTSTDGKKYNTRVYHPIGFLLIVMESGQPKAQQMKVAVAEFVWEFSGPQELPAKDRNAYIAEIEKLTERLTKTDNAMLFEQRLMSLQHYCRIAKWPMPNLEHRKISVDQLSLPGVGHE